MSDEVLRMRGVGVRREKSMLLRDVDWIVHSGESWVVIGPNGAGKTTLLQVAAALLPPTEGTAEILGENVTEADIFDLRTRIGLASAALADRVPPAEKVIDLVLTASYGILGRYTEDYESGDVTRAVELLDALGCAHLIRRRFATLSEGERKRVQIARSLMPDPELLLVMVTHHVEEVPPGFTHALLMRKGAVLAAGKVRDVFTARHLSKCFGLPLLVEQAGARWTARAAVAP